MSDIHLIPQLSVDFGPLPLVTLSLLPWPVLSLKQILLSTEEDSGAGPPRDGDGVPGGGAPGPTHTQEVEENLLSLEVVIKQLEVCWPRVRDLGSLWKEGILIYDPP